MSLTTLADVHAAFGAWLNLPSCEVVDVALASIVANRLEGDPLWLFLVAPPSGSKTEIIRALTDVPDIFPLSSLTAQTFASGFERKGAETSLLPRLDGKILTLKDFGTVLTMYREKRAEILAQLREIYDGSFKKEFGNGKVVDWTGKVGLVAGCTPVIDRGDSAVNQALGERFLIYRVRPAPGYDVAKRAMLQQGFEADQRRHLRQVVSTFMAESVSVTIVPPTPEVMLDRLAALAEFTARARSPVFFNLQHGEIDYVPAPEGPGRLAKQLYTLARALAILRGHGETATPDYVTCFGIAQDSLPPQRRVMLEVLLSGLPRQRFETSEVAEQTKYPTTTARRYLQELAALDLAVRYPGGQGRPDQWAASDYLLELLEKAAVSSEELNHLTSAVSGVVV